MPFRRRAFELSIPIPRQICHMCPPEFEKLHGYVPVAPEELQQRADDFYDLMRTRRSVRSFSREPVPLAVIQKCILTAGTAPNGANLQPWHFAVVSEAETKQRIRREAEREEREFYQRRATPEWLEALAPLGTDDQKPFLELAPHLIVVFARSYNLGPDGEKTKNYYVAESVGIAVGLLIAALHRTGLATLTHTPSPMRFLNEILGRPDNERPFLVLVTGFPDPEAKVPKITRKSLEAITSYH